jgi:RIMS-binding protein 2
MLKLVLSPVSQHHYSHSEEYQTESSRGSDLSDIMEEDEDDLYSEMQLEEGRRRSINSHNTLKVQHTHIPHLVGV